jgi:bacterioferritin-associated ferredoxin
MAHLRRWTAACFCDGLLDGQINRAVAFCFSVSKFLEKLTDG